MTSSWLLFSFSLRQSRRAAPRPVRRVDQLRDDAFEPVLARGALERGTVVERRRDEDALDGGVEELLERLAPLRVRAVDERLAVHAPARRRRRRRARPRPAGAARTRSGRSRRARRSRRRAPPRASAPPGRQRVRDGGEPVVRSLSLRLLKVATPPCDARQRPETVPLGLEHPVLPDRQDIGRGGEHRRVVARLAPRVLAQQQPVLLLAVEVGRHERPQPLEPVAVEMDREAPSFFSSTSSYVPRSQISTVPAPYCPAGISPSKSP